ncbi:MAG TPA: hypothetical protein VFI73_05275 [Candidatus Nitrosopolaris sp.]|nr:hypothetical protein [Candidatus Nitrosopolaris sp.]
MVPSTDNVWLLVVDNRSGLKELVIHGGDVAVGRTAIAFWGRYKLETLDGREIAMNIINNDKII